MKIALYRNPGLFGWLIKWRTWGRYSHAAHVLPTGEIIEARLDGVRKRRHVLYGYSSKTIVDVFYVPGISLTKLQLLQHIAEERVRKEQQYDWRGILGFIFRLNIQNKQQPFCTELIIEDYLAIGQTLLARIPTYKVYPDLLSYSVKLKYVGTWYLEDTMARFITQERPM